MHAPNLGWLYYRHYFRDVNWKLVGQKIFGDEGAKEKAGKELGVLFSAKKQQLIDTKLDDYEVNDKPKLPKRNDKLSEFVLKTDYPGLLCGSGYGHNLKADEALKLGFFFDHTSGLPVIPGSSVKGKLRSVFPSFHENDKAQKKERGGFICELLQRPYDELFLLKFELETFEGVDIENTLKARNEGSTEFNWLKERKNWEYKSIYQRDVFFDAVLSGAGKSGKFLGEDFITPHKNQERNEKGIRKQELDYFTQPVPIAFLKVLPEVKFTFRFLLQGSKLFADNNKGIQAKKGLFEQILKMSGIGAKTNVGYGSLQ